MTYFDKIIADHREWAKSDGRSVGELLSMALDSQPCRGFRDALTGSGVSIIAEIKRRSPSKG
ncbi:MAG: indole-3-glycerol-phosphate synthase TrpC, partial [Acidimicrobiaceae bacterium]|nr:indole-3-glycerol-phosphate synthase TrpC [Acidimicrobiaceae bacterium]